MKFFIRLNFTLGKSVGWCIKKKKGTVPKHRTNFFIGHQFQVNPVAQVRLVVLHFQ